MFIRYNTQSGRLGIYATRKEAGTDMPVYASEKEMEQGAVTINQLAVFYAETVRCELRRFPDKPTAARRSWAAAKAKLAGEELPNDEFKAMPANKEALKEIAKETRGRRPGSAAFGGKTIKPKRSVNPRQKAGGHGWNSFNILLANPDGIKYEDYIAAGGRPQDLRWDLDRGFASIK